MTVTLFGSLKLAAACPTPPVALLLPVLATVTVRQRYPPDVVDSVTPPCSRAGAMIGLRKSVIFCNTCCTLILLLSSSCFA